MGGYSNTSVKMWQDPASQITMSVRETGSNVEIIINKPGKVRRVWFITRQEALVLRDLLDERLGTDSFEGFNQPTLVDRLKYSEMLKRENHMRIMLGEFDNDPLLQEIVRERLRDNSRQ